MIWWLACPDVLWAVASDDIAAWSIATVAVAMVRIHVEIMVATVVCSHCFRVCSQGGTAIIYPTAQWVK